MAKSNAQKRVDFLRNNRRLSDIAHDNDNDGHGDHADLMADFDTMGGSGEDRARHDDDDESPSEHHVFNAFDRAWNGR